MNSDMTFYNIRIETLKDIKKINKKLNNVSGSIIAEGIDSKGIAWRFDLKSIHGLIGAVKNGVSNMTVYVSDFYEIDKNEISSIISKFKI